MNMPLSGPGRYHPWLRKAHSLSISRLYPLTPSFLAERLRHAIEKHEGGQGSYMESLWPGLHSVLGLSEEVHKRSLECKTCL